MITIIIVLTFATFKRPVIVVMLFATVKRPVIVVMPYGFAHNVIAIIIGLTFATFRPVIVVIIINVVRSIVILQHIANVKSILCSVNLSSKSR